MLNGFLFLLIVGAQGRPIKIPFSEIIPCEDLILT